MRRLTRIAPLCAAATLAAAPAAAEEEIGARLAIELNTARSVESGCELSFLATNGHDGDVEAAVFEAVLFDTEGRVERLTLLDFGTLPAGRPRVRQFVLPETNCEALGEVLFNGATDCAAGDLGPGACTAGLELRSRTEIGVIG